MPAFIQTFPINLSCSGLENFNIIDFSLRQSHSQMNFPISIENKRNANQAGQNKPKGERKLCRRHMKSYTLGTFPALRTDEHKEQIKKIPHTHTHGHTKRKDICGVHGPQTDRQWTACRKIACPLCILDVFICPGHSRSSPECFDLIYCRIHEGARKNGNALAWKVT